MYSKRIWISRIRYRTNMCFFRYPHVNVRSRGWEPAQTRERKRHLTHHCGIAVPAIIMQFLPEVSSLCYEVSVQIGIKFLVLFQWAIQPGSPPPRFIVFASVLSFAEFPASRGKRTNKILSVIWSRKIII